MNNLTLDYPCYRGLYLVAPFTGAAEVSKRYVETVPQPVGSIGATYWPACMAALIAFLSLIAVVCWLLSYQRRRIGAPILNRVTIYPDEMAHEDHSTLGAANEDYEMSKLRMIPFGSSGIITGRRIGQAVCLEMGVPKYTAANRVVAIQAINRKIGTMCPNLRRKDVVAVCAWALYYAFHPPQEFMDAKLLIESTDEVDLREKWEQPALVYNYRYTGILGRLLEACGANVRPAVYNF